ncbi:ABC transporter permease [Nocardioides cavernaquae]|uniref:ABC transporter permease subunit n=1 Tax=Nocardioides cavernaquae TaxID=2321396 RepID=A0A3A5HAW7_9ACTN|nr:ABC transporter permease subunit [Nocardioides cavernaquae]RJS45117.1 ABC transporter permease subunit [Nocardioides cavernaquae]
MTWFLDNFSHIRDLALTHLWLSIVPVVLGFVIAVPVGWWAQRHSRWRALVLGSGGILYSLPSLPLLVILPGILGTSFLDPVNVVVVLTLYAVALLVRTAADAFAQLPPDVLDAATANGHSGLQRVVRVELPLAGPVLLAGVRVVSVSTVSLVTVGAIIGVTNLGSLFTDGFRRDFTTEIVIGVLAVVAIALLLDGLWVLLGRILLPWSTKTGRAA